MIVGYVGPLGSGKSLGMEYDGYRWSLEAKGAPIWANIAVHPGPFEPHRQQNPLRFKIGRIRTVADVLRAIAEGGGILQLDEIHQLLDARLGLNMQNILLTEFIVFLRKAGLTMQYTTQHEWQVDKRLRAVTDVLTTCRAFGPKGNRTHEFTRWEYLARRPLQVVTLTPDQTRLYHSLYNTYEFTHRIKFPSKPDEFERFMLAIEEAAVFARTNTASPAWESFLLQSKYAEEVIGSAGRPDRTKKRVRRAPHDVGGAGLPAGSL